MRSFLLLIASITMLAPLVGCQSTSKCGCEDGPVEIHAAPPLAAPVGHVSAVQTDEPGQILPASVSEAAMPE